MTIELDPPPPIHQRIIRRIRRRLNAAKRLHFHVHRGDRTEIKWRCVPIYAKLSIAMVKLKHNALLFTPELVGKLEKEDKYLASLFDQLNDSPASFSRSLEDLLLGFSDGIDKSNFSRAKEYWPGICERCPRGVRHYRWIWALETLMTECWDEERDGGWYRRAHEGVLEEEEEEDEDRICVCGARSVKEVLEGHVGEMRAMKKQEEAAAENPSDGVGREGLGLAGWKKMGLRIDTSVGGGGQPAEVKTA